MGAWGIGTFENDTACDWAYGLEDVDDLSLIKMTLAQLLEVGEDYLEVDPATEALAACEVIARLRGSEGDKTPFSEAADRWVESHAALKESAPIDAALSAIDRILTPPSELLELWTDSDDFESWRASVLELRERLRA